MPGVLLLPAFWGAVGATAMGTGAIVGAHETAGATEQAANTAAGAVEQGQTLQAQATEEALQFQKQQAEAQYQQQEQTLQANYNQWVASRQGAQTMRSLLGLPSLDIPAFVPGIDPNYTGAPTAKGGAPVAGSPTSSPSSATSSTSGYTFAIPPGMNPSNPVDKLVLDQFQAGIKAGKTDPGSQPTAANMAYWTQQINATGGATPSNLAYWTSKMSAGATNAPTSSPSSNSLATYLQTNSQPVTGLLQPTNPYLQPTSTADAFTG